MNTSVTGGVGGSGDPFTAPKLIRERQPIFPTNFSKLSQNAKVYACVEPSASRGSALRPPGHAVGRLLTFIRTEQSRLLMTMSRHHVSDVVSNQSREGSSLMTPTLNCDVNLP